MKRIALGFAALFMSCAAFAQTASGWHKMARGMYIAAPQEGGWPGLMVSMDGNTGRVMLVFMHPGAKVCQRNGQNLSAMIGPVGTYSIDGVPVSFTGYCVNGNELIKPTTVRGSEVFVSTFALASKAVPIKMADGSVLHYPTVGFKSAEDDVILGQSSL